MNSLFTGRRFSHLWGQTVIVVLIMTIIGSLLVYVYAQRRYARMIEKDYDRHWNTMQTVQQEIFRFASEQSSFDLSNAHIHYQLALTLEQAPQLFRLSLLDQYGNILWGKETKRVTEYVQTVSASTPQEIPSIMKHAQDIVAFHQQIHLVQLPLLNHQQPIGFLRGEFFPIDSGTALNQVTKMTLQITAVATGFMIFSGVILIFTQITRHLSAKQKRLEDYAVSLEKTSEDLRRVRKDLQVSEKLASLGYLAAGIAHEIGNPLGSVLGYIELLQKASLDDAKMRDILQRIEKEIERIRRIIQELVHFSRPRTLNVQRLDLNKILRKTIAQLPPDPNKDVNITLQLTEFPLFAEVDEHKLQSVFFNIIRNGMDAIAATGSIRISTSRRIRESATMISGSEVIAIQFSDNGGGIPEEHLGKVFDPFFTTKDPGAGMGLGLSLCHRIIESLNGEIEIHSIYGQGTDVTIFLPPARKKEQPEKREA